MTNSSYIVVEYAQLYRDNSSLNNANSFGTFHILSGRPQGRGECVCLRMTLIPYTSLHLESDNELSPAGCFHWLLSKSELYWIPANRNCPQRTSDFYSFYFLRDLITSALVSCFQRLFSYFILPAMPVDEDEYEPENYKELNHN
ncbi:uncharacterized protein PGTG_09160 [Puccinia graminis f. sp. tritici CRL 75-36-700-3]|uniref:Uncharacterized protein n=1 Tax=Puccinia graminis f. sp. tritici (strain CRL 75-36-700-3 / race SCCL) TaxID=418459 RepID=E3KFS2_PUCGT|nr:uncharacterized protein PGTG_09160 [Puccinia graminis f. sp. tritici CRL 75-36-700-3]EFP83207.1 hypothetical protein PGTG_09160 [Puccinia graminis f. sp. tritici CRL 75-36-700-3]